MKQFYFQLIACFALGTFSLFSQAVPISIDSDNAYAGFSVGQSSINADAGSFRVQDQDIQTKINDSSTSFSAFFGLPFQLGQLPELGVEFALHRLGNYDFTAQLTGSQNIGTGEGEQDFWGMSGGIYYQHDFSDFSVKGMLGGMYARLTVDGELDLIGQTEDQSLDYSENSGNLFFSLEAKKQVYKEWSLAPAFSLIQTGDTIQTLSLKLSRQINN